MSGEGRTLWRVFPWDPAAAEGERFSAAFVAGGQGRGRFDLPDRPSGVLYLAETPEHAVAESIQRFRNQPVPLDADDLTVMGRPLALVPVTLDAQIDGGIADLCDPATLVRHAVPPDRTAARTRATSQRVSAEIYEAGYAGLRWWSAFWGEWHTVVVFRDRLAARLAYGAPAALDLSHHAVAEAARSLDVPLR